MFHRSENSLIEVNQAILAAGQGTTNCAGVDCAGFSAVRWLVPITTTLDTGTISVQHQHSDTDASYVNSSAPASSLTDAGGSAYNGRVIPVEIAQPVKRWNRIVIVRGVANSALGTVIVERSRAIASPTTVDAAKIAGAVKSISPT